ncbi:MAG: glutamate racemase [Candidatus Coatesbacteria bacterium]|nr:glutamate racemase [Candidatus Coatesbacteria bacterium]
MPNSSSPIGVFDSGIGGLSVVKALTERLPNENYIYLGDTARVPYGTKTKSTITRFSIQDTRFLLDRGVKMVVVACNSASSASVDALRSEFDIPIIGVIEPGAQAAVKATNSGVIGVIGTEATVNSQCYHREILKLKPGANVIAKPCPLFVPLVEEGWLNDSITRQVAEKYLTELKDAGVDVLILGCTHYPLLAPLLADVMGKGTTIVDSASSVSAAVESLLAEKGLSNTSTSPGRREFHVTDLPAKVSQIGRMFLGIDDLEIELAEVG